jgi:hypothetical protein
VLTADGAGGAAWEAAAGGGWDGTTALDVTVAGVASTPPVKFTGSWFTGGTATTTKPQLLIEPAGTPSTAWSTAGTGLGINAPSGFTGNLLDLQVNGASRYTQSNTAIRWTLGSGRWLNIDDNCNLTFGGTGVGGIQAGNASASFATVRCQQYFAAAGNNVTVQFNGSLSGDHGSALILSGRDHANRSGFTLRGGIAASDLQIGLSVVRGVTAWASSTTNIVGGSVAIEGGAGASGSADAASGGDVLLDGGQGFGTGVNGRIRIGATRGVLEIAGALTVATLPATPVVGMIARVTDADAPAIGSTVAGGGAANALVWYNGANWTVLNTVAQTLVQSDTTGIAGADAVTNIVSLTQAEYDAIGAPSATTLYVITA